MSLGNNDVYLFGAHGAAALRFWLVGQMRRESLLLFTRKFKTGPP